MDTKIDVYEPTAAEKRLLAVMLDPENIGKNITEICQLADISRQAYYKIMKKPEFVAYQEKLCRDLVKQYLSPLIAATFKYALLPQNHQDRKMLLEMGGLYTPKQQQVISGPGGVPLGVVILPEVKIPDGKT